MIDFDTPGVPEALLDATLDIVRRAGDMVAEAASRPKNVRAKGRIDLVTETDLAVEAFLKRELGALLPGSTFLAEESASHAAVGDLTWIIDPLDGTTNFAHGLPVHAVSVALWRDGRGELGVVNAPVLGEVFHAARGMGAFCNGRPMHVTDTAVPERALVATGFPYAIREVMAPVLETMEKVLAETRGLRRMGAAAVDLAFVAAGRFDAFYELLLNPWDVAAGLVLMAEAGGRVTRFDPSQPYVFGAKDILATNGPLHETVAGWLPQNPLDRNR